ncbi:MAG: hypothetical protein PHH30_11350, partial [Bacteroidales bacterium]|nr:hypothetical protein [Bacteroidales bacterium]
MEKKIKFFTISLFLILSSEFVLGLVNPFDIKCFYATDRLEQTDSKAKIKSIEQSKFYIFNSEINFNSLAERTKMTFNDTGLITVLERYGSADLLIYWDEYKYDNNGFLIKTFSYKNDSVLRDKKLNKYDKKGIITKQMIYDEKGQRIANSFYKTDEQGRVVEMEQFSAKGHNPLLYVTKKYDIDGNLVEMFQSIDKDGNGERYVYLYDSDNLNTGMDHFNEFGDLVESLRYKYTFDENGNWVQRTITNMNVLVF